MDPIPSLVMYAEGEVQEHEADVDTPLHEKRGEQSTIIQLSIVPNQRSLSVAIILLTYTHVMNML